MSEADTLTPPPLENGSLDAIAAMAVARDQMLSEARQTWDSIQSMDAGPERVRMQAEFSRTSAELIEATQADPFFQEHATIAHAGDDLFAHLTPTSLQHVREGLELDDPSVRQIDSALDDMRDALTVVFSSETELMAQMSTTAEELAEYLLQGEHSVAQAEAWRGRAEALDEDASARLTDMLEEGHRRIRLLHHS